MVCFSGAKRFKTAQVKFKILLLTFHCLQGTVPFYLQDLVHKYIPFRSLRSKSKSLLVTSTPITKSSGAHSFQAAAELMAYPSLLRRQSRLSNSKIALKLIYSPFISICSTAGILFVTCFLYSYKSIGI